MALLSRVFPMNVTELSGLIQPLPADGVVPGLPDWQWLLTPGHSPGHVSFFGPEYSVLLAGDAFTTVNIDSFVNMTTKRGQLSVPPPPFTCDWRAAGESVALLAALNPQAIGCGHGRPLSGPELPARLHDFSAHFTPPAQGRYVRRPAETDLNGIVSLPPPAPDLFPVQTAALVALLAAGHALSRR